MIESAAFEPKVCQTKCCIEIERIFDGGHWIFESVPDDLKTLHYVAGRACYLVGEKV